MLTNFSRPQRLRISYSLLIICVTKAAIWSAISTLPNSAVAAPLSEFMDRDQRSLHTAAPSSLASPSAPSSEFDSVLTQARDNYANVAPVVVDAPVQQPTSFISNAHGTVHSASSQHASTASAVGSESTETEAAGEDASAAGVLRANENYFRTMQAIEHEIDMLGDLTQSEIEQMKATFRRSMPLEITVGGQGMSVGARSRSVGGSITKIRQPGYCATYGTCDKPSNPLGPVNCPNNTLAVKPDFDITQFCPQFADKACCNKVQYQTLSDNLNQAIVILQRCPACINNFIRFWCAYTCSPDQSVFVEVVETKIGSLGLPVSNHTAFNVGYDFAWGFFNSCLNVRFGATGLTVLGALFGNPQTPVQLFSFMGTPPTSPFLISMTVTDQGVTNNTLVNYASIPCNSSDYSEQCSCVDCPAICSGGGGSTAPNPNEYRNETVDVLKVGDNYFDTVNLGLLLGYVLYLAVLVLSMAYFMNHKGRWGLFAIGAIAALLVVIAIIYGAAAPEVKEYTFPLHRTTLTGGYDYKTVLNTGHVEVFNSFWTSGAFSGYVVLVAALVIAAVCGAILFHRLQHSLAVSHSGLFREEKKGDANPSRFLLLVFGNIAKVCARYPWTVILGCLVATGLCSIGILKLQIETDPVKLWVPPDSDVIAEKNFFDSHFAPFYRVNQFIVTMSDPLPGESILNPKYLHKVLDLQSRVENITATYKGKPVVWGDLCFRPIPGKGCMLESVTEYFSLYNTTNGYIPDDPAEALSWIMHCSQQFMYDSKCRGVVGAPNFPYVVMGGYPKGTTLYNETTALVVTYLLNNYPNITDMAEEWENKFLEIMAAGEPGLHLAYNAERSVSDELSRGSTSDISIVVISYVVMFVYISFALGRVFPFDYKLIFVRTKFVLGFSAILIVFCSLAISVGICSAAGVSVTPIISEVIPFLVLAIGIDNVFIILGTFQNQDPRKSIEERLTVTLVHVGTSISLASLSESFAFMLGALTKMPAVRSFAFYSAVAIFADYLLQITAFCAVLVLDARRRDQNRIDCLPCIQVEGVKERDYSVDYVTIPGNNSAPVRVMGSEDQASLLHGEHGVVDSNYMPTVDVHAGVSPSGGPGQMVPKDGILKTFMRNYFVPVILHRITKIVVLVVFVGYFLFSIGYMYHNLQLGLDQAQAVPTDSYLQEYFKDIATILRVGPPVYFVVKGGTPTTNFSLIPNQNRICGINHCPANSLETLAAQASTHSLMSYMAPGATVMNWFDDYNSWMLATGSPCCRVFANGTYCPTEYNAGIGECPPCITDNSQIVNNSRVITPVFRQWLQTFLTKSSCTTQCGSCGWGHNADVELTPDGLDIANSRYPTFHTPLQTQADFINAVKQARQLAQNISAEQNLEVFPYSVFYVYFDQYLYIQGVAILNTGLAGAGIFVLCLVVTWSFWASLIIMITIGMILGCLLGVMALWNISLNAVSTVNFVMAIGISVEFCIHIAVAFLRSYGSRDHRVGAALVNVGSSVVSGITLTKLCGVITLGFASSEIFIIYYFRMYFAIVILGFFHGLVFLPVVLSLVGPEQYDSNEKTEEDSDNDSNRDESESRREVDNEAYHNVDERVSGGVNDYGSTAGHNYSTF